MSVSHGCHMGAGACRSQKRALDPPAGGRGCSELPDMDAGSPERSARAPNHWAASPARNNLRYVWFRDRSGCHVSVFGWQWLLGACGKPHCLPATPALKFLYCQIQQKANLLRWPLGAKWEPENRSYTHGQFLKSIVKNTAITEDFRKAFLLMQSSQTESAWTALLCSLLQSTGGEKHSVFHLQRKVRHSSIKAAFSLKGTILPISMIPFLSLFWEHIKA